MPHFNYDIQTGFILPDVIVHGTRDNTVFKYLCSLRAKGADEEQLTAAAYEVNERCKPPMNDHELMGRVRSAMGYDAGTSGYNGPRTAIHSKRTPKKVDRCVEPDVLPDLSDMTPREQIEAYLRACYDVEDEVCFVRTIDNTDDDVHHFVGTLLGMVDGVDPLSGMLGNELERGVWITANPMQPLEYDCVFSDGRFREGRGRKNVAAYKNMLIECDELEMEFQLERILSIFWGFDGLRAIVDSGNKSYHCILRADAKDEYDFKRLAENTYDDCDFNGLPTDHSCSSTTRLTRAPGFMRRETGRMQRLVYAHGIA